MGHPGEIDEIFDTISYNKGASVIRMLHQYVGDQVSNYMYQLSIINILFLLTMLTTLVRRRNENKESDQCIVLIITDVTEFSEVTFFEYLCKILQVRSL